MNFSASSNKITYEIDYQYGLKQFDILLHMENLDRRVGVNNSLLHPFEEPLDVALSEAFNADSAEPNLFLQRILYRINRLKLFWYDDLENYANETSPYLASVRSRIENAWQGWETGHFDMKHLQNLPVKDALRQRAADDLSPAPSGTSQYFREEMTEAGYRQLLQIASLDGLVEASQLSRVLGGVGNEVQSVLTRIFLEEYGGGKLARKHTSFFSAMLEELGMDSQPEAYFDIVPWEVIANVNHSFVLCERKRNFLRYVGGLLYTEISAPAAFNNYLQAGMRLGLSETSTGYWALHIKEDERHGEWMLDDVAFPLVDNYGDSAWEIIWGYDQQKLISSRASHSVAQSLRATDNT